MRSIMNVYCRPSVSLDRLPSDTASQHGHQSTLCHLKSAPGEILIFHFEPFADVSFQLPSFAPHAGGKYILLPEMFFKGLKFPSKPSSSCVLEAVNEPYTALGGNLFSVINFYYRPNFLYEKCLQL